MISIWKFTILRSVLKRKTDGTFVWNKGHQAPQRININFRQIDTEGSKQRYRIFFYADMDVGYSFIQIQKSCFFLFPRSGKKKTQHVFFYFPRKSSSVIHSDFDDVPIFFNKSCLCFFFPIFLVFFCFFSFPRKSSKVIHSFNFWSGKKKTNREIKKNSFFIHSFDNPQKFAKTNFSREIKKYGTFAYT